MIFYFNMIFNMLIIIILLDINKVKKNILVKFNRFLIYNSLKKISKIYLNLKIIP